MQGARVETVDLSGSLRILGVLQTFRNLGYVLGSLAVLGTPVSRWLLLASATFFIASYLMGKGSRGGALALIVLAMTFSLLLERDYRQTLEHWEARNQAEPSAPATIGLRRQTLELSRGLALFFAALALVYAAMFVLTVLLRRRLPRPRSNLSFRQRTGLRTALLRARVTPKSVLYSLLTLACAGIALAPGIMVVGSFVLADPSRPPRRLPEWVFDVSWSRLVLTLVMVVGTLFFMARAKRHASLSVQQAQAVDPRPPILLLRSFREDMTPLTRTDDQYAWQRSLLVPSVWTLEETIETLLRAHGPVIAIGRPGEKTPPAGAARQYVPNEEWQERVVELIAEAGLVVVVLGESEGLRYEYQALVVNGATGKLILVVPPRDESGIRTGWSRFAAVAGDEAMAVAFDPARAIAAQFERDGIMTMVTAPRRDDENVYRMALDYCLATRQRVARAQASTDNAGVRLP